MVDFPFYILLILKYENDFDIEGCKKFLKQLLVQEILFFKIKGDDNMTNLYQCPSHSYTEYKYLYIL